MKNIITLLFALVAFTINAQTDSTINKIDSISTIKIDTAESTEIDFGNVKIIIKDKDKKTIKKDKDLTKDDKPDKIFSDEEDEDEYPNVDFNITFGMGVAGYSEVNDGEPQLTVIVPPTSTASLDLDYGKSRNYMINGNLMFDIHKNFGILTGLGVEFNRYVFKENLQVTPNEGNFVKDSVISFGSYKFKTNYLNIPLMLVFKTNNQNFKFAFGGTFSYNIGNKVKQEYSIENVDYKSTIKGNYNVAPIKLSVGARLAYKGIGLYFNYGLTEMNDNTLNTAKSGRGTNLMPFSAGITLGGL